MLKLPSDQANLKIGQFRNFCNVFSCLDNCQYFACCHHQKYHYHYHISILLADQWSQITFGRLPSFLRRIILPLGRQSDCVFARPVILISGLVVDDADDDEDLPSILSATTPSLATARTEMQRALSWDRHELSRMILMMNNNWWLMIIHIFYTSMWRSWKWSW